METYIIWFVLALVSWLALMLKTTKISLFNTTLFVSIGVLIRIVQEFLKYVLRYFFGATMLDKIFGPFISAFFLFSFFIIPLLYANKAKEPRLVMWLYLLFGYFLTAFAAQYIFIIIG